VRISFRQRKNLSHASAPPTHFELGRRGEQLAVEYLIRSHYRIVAANVVLPIGRNLREVPVSAEIDLIAYDGPTLCFIEVKTRASDESAPPLTNMDLRKRRQVARAAQVYRRMFGLTDAPYRYDVVTVVMGRNKRRPARVELLKNFWTDANLHQRNRHHVPWD
jgi:putative endonuclease